MVIGVEKFGNYFRRKGWIDGGEKREAGKLVGEGRATDVEEEERIGKGKGIGRISKWWGRGETGTRLVVEFATAYAVVKVLLPLRLVVSVWGAPWFARWTVLPLSNMVKGLFRGRAKKAGLGATATVEQIDGTKAATGGKTTRWK